MANTGTADGTGAQGGSGSGTGQEPNADGQTGQEPEGQQGQEQTGQENGNQDVDHIDPATITDPAVRAYVEKMQAANKEARDQAARYRTERNTFRDQVTQHQQENETAEQKAAREQTEREQAQQQERERLAMLEKENRDLRVGGAVRDKARDAKAFNPALVETMLKDKVTLNDKGEPENLDELLKGLRETDPYLFRRTSHRDAGSGQGAEASPEGTNMNDFIRGQVAARRGQS